VRFRYEVSIGPEDVGRRVTVRFRRGPHDLADVVGLLESCDDEAFAVRDRSGTLRTIDRTVVVAARVVAPPRT
jgi:N-acetylglutamate synthase